MARVLYDGGGELARGELARTRKTTDLTNYEIKCKTARKCRPWNQIHASNLDMAQTLRSFPCVAPYSSSLPALTLARPHNTINPPHLLKLRATAHEIFAHRIHDEVVHGELLRS